MLPDVLLEQIVGGKLFVAVRALVAHFYMTKNRTNQYAFVNGLVL